MASRTVDNTTVERFDDGFGELFNLTQVSNYPSGWESPRDLGCSDEECGR